MEKSNLQTSSSPSVRSHHIPSSRPAQTYRLLLGRLILFALPLLVGLLLPTILKNRRGFVESYYSSALYPHIAKAIESITGLVPFSLCEILLYVIIIATAASVIICLIRVLLRRSSFYRFLSLLVTLVLIGGIGVNLFYLTWGLNYFRLPLKDRLSISVQQRDTEELYTLSLSLAAQANEIRSELTEDGNGVFTADMDESLAALPAAYQTLSAINPVFSGPVSCVKKVLLSEGLSYLDIAGIYIGITAEANVNVHQPPLYIAADGAHELAHQLGNASENEAELTGILACLCSENVSVRYSGTVKALVRCTNALYAADRELFFAVRDTYGEGLIRDLVAYNAYWKAYEGPVSEASDSMNDSYLKHNEVSSGIRSYGESVDLLLAVNATEWGNEILSLGLSQIH